METARACHARPRAAARLVLYYHSGRSERSLQIAARDGSFDRVLLRLLADAGDTARSRCEGASDAGVNTVIRSDVVDPCCTR